MYLGLTSKVYFLESQLVGNLDVCGNPSRANLVKTPFCGDAVSES
jgi:hypothetical protein